MTRADRTMSERIDRVARGEVDPVSKAAYYARVPLCVAVNPRTGKDCTRPAGHDENRVGHPAQDHVHTGLHFIARDVWP